MNKNLESDQSKARKIRDKIPPGAHDPNFCSPRNPCRFVEYLSSGSGTRQSCVLEILSDLNIQCLCFSLSALEKLENNFDNKHK